jgi:hypothetical protein
MGNSKKIIFLDHDGVICLSSEWGSRHKKQKSRGRRDSLMSMQDIPIEYRFDNFNKEAIEVLNEILKETDAEIVVSSDWKRWATVEEMGEYYELQGISKKPIGYTPNLSECTNYDDEFPWNRGLYLEQTRSLEIKQYLINNPSIENWVAVDDLDMGKIVIQYSMEYIHEWGLNNFVLTPRENEGIKQISIKEKIISFLNGSK